MGYLWIATCLFVGFCDRRSKKSIQYLPTHTKSLTSSDEVHAAEQQSHLHQLTELEDIATTTEVPIDDDKCSQFLQQFQFSCQRNYLNMRARVIGYIPLDRGSPSKKSRVSHLVGEYLNLLSFSMNEVAWTNDSCFVSRCNAGKKWLW